MGCGASSKKYVASMDSTTTVPFDFEFTTDDRRNASKSREGEKVIALDVDVESLQGADGEKALRPMMRATSHKSSGSISSASSSLQSVPQSDDDEEEERLKMDECRAMRQRIQTVHPFTRQITVHHRSAPLAAAEFEAAEQEEEAKRQAAMACRQRQVSGDQKSIAAEATALVDAWKTLGRGCDELAGFDTKLLAPSVLS